MRLTRLQLVWACAQLVLPLLLLGLTAWRRPDLTGPVWDGPLGHLYGGAPLLALGGVGLQLAAFQVLARREGPRKLLLGLAGVGPLLACTLPACALILFLPILHHLLGGDMAAREAFRERIEAFNRGEPRPPPETLHASTPADLARRARAYRAAEPLAAPLPEAK